jgi:hypothetical protein
MAMAGQARLVNSFNRLLLAACFFFCQIRNPQSAIYILKSTIFSVPFQTSHPELRKKVPRLKNSGHPDQDEREANPEGFELAIAKETEQRIGNKNESSDRGEQNQCEKVVGVTLSHEVEIEQRTGNQ